MVNKFNKWRKVSVIFSSCKVSPLQTFTFYHSEWRNIDVVGFGVKMLTKKYNVHNYPYWVKKENDPLNNNTKTKKTLFRGRGVFNPLKVHFKLYKSLSNETVLLVAHFCLFVAINTGNVLKYFLLFKFKQRNALSHLFSIWEMIDR